MKKPDFDSAKVLVDENLSKKIIEQREHEMHEEQMNQPQLLDKLIINLLD